MTQLQPARDMLQVVADTLTEEQINFLSYRICGFSKLESTVYSKTSASDLALWEQSEEFKSINTVLMKEFRGVFIQEILNQTQVQNTRALMELDSKVIKKALEEGIEKLSDNTMIYLNKIRTQYNPNLRKVLGLEEQDLMPTSFDEVILIMRNNNDKQAQGNIIDVEYEEDSE